MGGSSFILSISLQFLTLVFHLTTAEESQYSVKSLPGFNGDLPFNLQTAEESQYSVKSLPGFNGDLPFNLQTGYISVGKNNEQQLFYYFIQSERNPHKDPLILSIAGGPGCSSFSTLAFEFGPFTFNSSTYGWTLPSLLLNPYSWTKMANIIFLDWPVGTGFSYSTTPQGYHTSDSSAPQDIYAFLVKWLMNHPEFISSRLYLQGESYGGKIVPMVASEISKANERGLLPQMSLHGYLVGSPATYVHGATNDRLLHAHNLGLISYQYFKEAETSCNGEYVDVDVNNRRCLSALQVINECLDDMNKFQILEPVCPKINNHVKMDQTNHASFNILLSSPSLKPLCRDEYRTISEDWANNPSVRNALGVREGTKDVWTRINESVVVDKDVISSIEYHRHLAKKGYHGLIYNGDHDFVAPYFSCLKWIHSLDLLLDDNWRPWKVDGQVAGFTIRYRSANESYLTFATIKGSGHTAPEYNPKECFAMVYRWLSDAPI